MAGKAVVFRLREWPDPMSAESGAGLREPGVVVTLGFLFSVLLGDSDR